MFFYGNGNEKKLITLLYESASAKNNEDFNKCLLNYVTLYKNKENETSLLSENYIEIFNELKEDITKEIDYNSPESLEENGYYKARFVIHFHEATNDHWDLRFSLPPYTAKNNKIYPSKYCFSFAIPKMKFPEEHEKKLAIRQPIHSSKWLDLESTKIKDGYGAGNISTVESGIVYIKQSKKTYKLFFPIKTKNHDNHYMLINTDSENYLFIKNKK